MIAINGAQHVVVIAALHLAMLPHLVIGVNHDAAEVKVLVAEDLIPLHQANALQVIPQADEYRFT
jgi:hypothetical protein